MVNNLMVAAKVGIVILFIVVGAFYVEPTHWTNNFAPTGFSGVMLAATTVFFALTFVKPFGNNPSRAMYK